MTAAEVYTDRRRDRIVIGYIAYTTAHVLLTWISCAIAAANA